MKKIDFKKYVEFVEGVTSQTSNDLTTFHDRLDDVDANAIFDGGLTHGPDINVPLALTSAMGLCGEAGEFSEIFKKVFFHGKQYTAETKAHASKELGDVIFYWTNACRALGLDPDTVIAENVSKLEARYPGGKFSVQRAEYREVGDI